jgi:hypothetical protein
MTISGMTNKAISTKFLNIIIRTNPGQTDRNCHAAWRFGEFRILPHLSCPYESKL